VDRLNPKPTKMTHGYVRELMAVGVDRHTDIEPWICQRVHHIDPWICQRVDNIDAWTCERVDDIDAWTCERVDHHQSGYAIIKVDVPMDMSPSLE